FLFLQPALPQSLPVQNSHVKADCDAPPSTCDNIQVHPQVLQAPPLSAKHLLNYFLLSRVPGPVHSISSKNILFIYCSSILVSSCSLFSFSGVTSLPSGSTTVNPEKESSTCPLICFRKSSLNCFCSILSVSVKPEVFCLFASSLILSSPAIIFYPLFLIYLKHV